MKEGGCDRCIYIYMYCIIVVILSKNMWRHYTQFESVYTVAKSSIISLILFQSHNYFLLHPDPIWSSV
jgi:hypothetical protein